MMNRQWLTGSIDAEVSRFAQAHPTMQKRIMRQAGYAQNYLTLRPGGRMLNIEKRYWGG